MSTKIASIVASVITAILVLLCAIFFGLGGIILLNGFMNADVAVYTGFICLGVGVILSAILAGVLTSTFISKFQWSNTLALLVSIGISALLGSGLSFASMMLMVIIAEATL
jgi:hypothetical protein